jgi:hypothetical protein
MTDSSTAKPDEEIVVTTTETEEGAVKEVDANTAESSDADEGAKQPASLLDAVKSALKDPEADAAKTGATGESPNSEAGEKESASTTSEADKKAAEEEPPPFHTHPRWKKLVQERDTLRSDLERISKENGQQKEVVQRFEGFTNAVKQAGLNADDVNNGFEIMRLMKSDPLKAWEKLQPYVEVLSQFAGEKLPADLQKKVDDGVVDVDVAKELARTRSQTHFASERDKEREQQTTQAEQQRRIDGHVNAVSGAITAWENQWKEHDPDYQKKQPLVADKILALMNVEGYPRSTEAATDLAKRAKEAVEKQLGNLIPKRAEVRTVTGGSSAKSVTKQPGSMREAIANAARATT